MGADYKAVAMVLSRTLQPGTLSEYLLAPEIPDGGQEIRMQEIRMLANGANSH